MEHLELVLLLLPVSVCVLTGLARATGVPYPVLLVLGGSDVAVAPGVPDVEDHSRRYQRMVRDVLAAQRERVACMPEGC